MVQIGSSLCSVENYDYYEIVCKTTASSDTNEVDVTVDTNGAFATFPSSYEYQTSTAKITAITPTTLSSAGGNFFDLFKTKLGLCSSEVPVPYQMALTNI